jgi:hypothetical protein
MLHPFDVPSLWFSSIEEMVPNSGSGFVSDSVRNAWKHLKRLDMRDYCVKQRGNGERDVDNDGRGRRWARLEPLILDEDLSLDPIDAEDSFVWFFDYGADPDDAGWTDVSFPVQIEEKPLETVIVMPAQVEEEPLITHLAPGEVVPSSNWCFGPEPEEEPKRRRRGRRSGDRFRGIPDIMTEARGVPVS